MPGRWRAIVVAMVLGYPPALIPQPDLHGTPTVPGGNGEDPTLALFDLGGIASDTMILDPAFHGQGRRTSQKRDPFRYLPKWIGTDRPVILLIHLREPLSSSRKRPLHSSGNPSVEIIPDDLV